MLKILFTNINQIYKYSILEGCNFNKPACMKKNSKALNWFEKKPQIHETSVEINVHKGSTVLPIRSLSELIIMQRQVKI